MIQELLIDEEDMFFKEVSNEKYAKFFNYPKKEDFISTHIYTYRKNDKICAYFGLARCDTTYLCLSYLFVLEPYRRQGIAKEIIDWVVLRHPLDHIYGMVELDNKIALKFYRKYYRFLAANKEDFINYTFNVKESDLYHNEDNLQVIFN